MEYEERTERQERGDRGVIFQIVEHIGVLSESKGWRRELNVVSWNGMPPKFDIRDWDEDHEHMRKGLTLTKGELRELRSILQYLDLKKTEIPGYDSKNKKETATAITSVEVQAVNEGFTEQVPF